MSSYIFTLTQEQLNRVIAALSEQAIEQNFALIQELQGLAKLELSDETGFSSIPVSSN